MSDELRDRIEVAIWWAMFDGENFSNTHAAAQAVIDDLGLHVIETTGCVIGKLERP